MKNQKIILCINIFLLFIIIGLIFSQNRNINKELKIIKQMNESIQVTDLQTQIDNLNLEHKEYANSIQTAKRNFATAITNQGVATTENDTLEAMSNNISKILQARTKDATATAEDITKGKTEYVNGDIVTGTLVLTSSELSTFTRVINANGFDANSWTGKQGGSWGRNNVTYTVPNDGILSLSYHAASTADTTPLSMTVELNGVSQTVYNASMFQSRSGHCSTLLNVKTGDVVVCTFSATISSYGSVSFQAILASE